MENSCHVFQVVQVDVLEDDVVTHRKGLEDVEFASRTSYFAQNHSFSADVSSQVHDVISGFNEPSHGPDVAGLPGTFFPHLF